MATYVRYEFHNSDADMLKLKSRVMADGYGPKKFYAGAKLVRVVIYYGYQIAVVTGGNRIKVPNANNFAAFLYTYPIVKKNYMYLNRVHGSDEGSRFFDDTLEDKLGGARSMLGV